MILVAILYLMQAYVRLVMSVQAQKSEPFSVPAFLLVARCQRTRVSGVSVPSKNLMKEPVD
ncbi:hypothetical protein KTH_62530 [Thermosporothrix hazakensis]|nr:hypothetical protein KTH_62530 [Thermosporothrix hazakensis]